MPVRFSDVVLDTDRMVVERGGVEVPVEPQVFAVLAHLVAHRDRMVPKTELLDEIWGDRFVSESALTSRIKSARRAIGDNGRDQRLIRTVHGRGFRFVGVIDDETAASPPHGAGDGWTAAELDATVVAAVRAGRGVVVELVGASGRARTDLLEDVLHGAREDGLLVGRGAGELRSLAAVVGAFDEWVTRRPEMLDAVPVGCARELRTVLDGGEPTSRQRLALASSELVAAAGATGGAVLAIDDVHLIDRATLDLLDQLARTVRRVPVALVVSHRPGFTITGDSITVVVDSDEHTAEAVPASAHDPLMHIAAIGEAFDQAEFEAAADLDPTDARRVLDVAAAAGIIEPAAEGYRFTDTEQARRLAGELSAAAHAVAQAAVAERLVADGAPAARIADLLVAAGDLQAAAPHQADAAFAAAWAQGHADVLHHTERVDEVADPAVRYRLLDLRADTAAALGQPEAIRLYRDAVRLAPPEDVAWLRTRLARALLHAGDLEGALEAFDGVETTGGPMDGGILLVGGMLAYLQGDIDRAEDFAERARGLALAPGAPPQMLDSISLQGMIAHSRGEWFDRLRHEIRFLAESAELGTVFDSHACVAQYLLYGPTGRDEVVALAAELYANAEAVGARRAAGFALTLSGEAHLLAGELDAARADLSASVALHTELGAETGRAHALQRLADVELAAGRRAEAERICREALPLARWSPLSHHLIQRTYGTLIAAAPDARAAVAVVEEARLILDGPMSCDFCQVTVSVPSAIALAGVGRISEAEVEIEFAARCAARWEGPAWPAAVDEARAALAAAKGDHVEARALLQDATKGFEAARQPLDAARCLEALADSG